MTGCGTSEHAALAVAAQLDEALRAVDEPGGWPEPRQAFEAALDPRPGGVLIGVSHEGATVPTVAALQAAGGLGAVTAAITANAGERHRPGGRPRAHDAADRPLVVPHGRLRLARSWPARRSPPRLADRDLPVAAVEAHMAASASRAPAGRGGRRRAARRGAAARGRRRRGRHPRPRARAEGRGGAAPAGRLPRPRDPAARPLPGHRRAHRPRARHRPPPRPRGARAARGRPAARRPAPRHPHGGDRHAGRERRAGPPSSRAPAASSCRTTASSRRRSSRCCPRRSRCSTSRSASCTRRGTNPDLIRREQDAYREAAALSRPEGG